MDEHATPASGDKDGGDQNERADDPVEHGANDGGRKPSRDELDAVFRELVESFRPKPIPERYYSTLTKRAFEECSICHEGLANAKYTITKSMRLGECIFEAAVCSSCSEQIRECTSDASRRAMMKQYDHAISLMDDDRDIAEDDCRFCGRVLGPQDEFMYWGHFVDDAYLCDMHRCEACSDSLHESLSPETREERDRFRRIHFPGPPTLEIEPPRPVSNALGIDTTPSSQANVARANPA